MLVALSSTLENDPHFNLVDLPSPLFGAESRLRRHAYTSLQMKDMEASACDRLFFHAAEDAIFILVTATPGALVVVLIIRGAFFAFFHLDVSFEMNLMARVALSMTRVMIWSQCASRKGTLIQVLSRNMWNGRSILWESYWNGSRGASATKGAREELDSSCQALIFLIATNA
jgi:hypothetical protein